MDKSAANMGVWEEGGGGRGGRVWEGARGERGEGRGEKGDRRREIGGRGEGNGRSWEPFICPFGGLSGAC